MRHIFQPHPQEIILIEKIRNIAIIAHVDHGKTTLVDKLLSQSGTLVTRGKDIERVMDSNDQEKERGITIDLGFANLVFGDDVQLGIVDVPGHERFVKNMLAGVGGIDLVMLVIASLIEDDNLWD